MGEPIKKNISNEYRVNEDGSVTRKASDFIINEDGSVSRKPQEAYRTANPTSRKNYKRDKSPIQSSPIALGNESHHSNKSGFNLLAFISCFVIGLLLLLLSWNMDGRGEWWAILLGVGGLLGGGYLCIASFAFLKKD